MFVKLRNFSGGPFFPFKELCATKQALDTGTRVTVVSLVFLELTEEEEEAVGALQEQFDRLSANRK